MSAETETGLEQLDQYKWGFSKPENYVFKSRKGLSHEIVEEISVMKDEPQWMRDFRHKSLDYFLKRPMPTWGGDLSEINFDDIYYYIKPTQQAGATWDDLPAEIKDTFEQLGIPEAERKYLAGVGAQYECLTGDTRVYTARGLVPIREIVPGDTVFSFDEETNRIIPAKVRATAEKGEREVFEARVGTRRIKATANHPFLALTYAKAEDRQRGRYTREWKYLQDLTVGDLVAVTKTLPETGAEYTLQQPEIKTHGADGVDFSYRYNDVSLPEQTTEDLMWWLGLYIGDGFIHYTAGADKARVEVAIPDTDPAVRAELIRTTEKLFGITPIASDPYRVSINSTIIARFIEANGFAGKALEKRVPEWMFGLPQGQKLAFLGGYLDSDGYVRDAEKNHDVILTSGNRELLQDMAELLSLCGLPTSEIHRFESKHPTEPDRMVVGYRISVAGPFERIGSRSPRRLERMDKRKYHHDYSSAKGTYFQKHTTEFHGYAKIEAITPAGVAMVYDIEVDGPHNFVAEGLIVHNSEVIYHKVREDLEKLGVIFVDPGTGLREHEELFRKYFATVIPPNDNKFAALNSAVWSGGSFIYIPKGVHVEIPLQAYFRINAQNMGQFERTLIIADEDSYVHYVEGCTAPTYTTDSLHSAVVEIIVHKNARVRYTTIQNWSKNVYNLVTKRAAAYEGATMEWVDGNLGCLAQGSTVTTPDGVKTIESLEVGDKVLSYDDRAGQFVFRNVTAKRFSGMQPVHTVSVGERKLQVTANHPFYSYSYDPDAPKKLGRYNLGYVRADHLKEAIVPRTSIDYGSPHQLNVPNLTTEFVSQNQYATDLTMSRTRASRIAPMEYTNDDIMWLFGYWIGDGNIEVKAGKTQDVVRYAKVGFSTPTTDRARERLVGTMTALVDTPPTERADGHHLAWSNKELAEFFAINGFTGKAINKRVPVWVWSLPESQRLAFIAGYLDADGCVIRGRFSLKSANRELLEDISSLLVTLGVTSRLHTEFAEPRQVEIMGVMCTAHSAYRLVFAADPRFYSHVSPTLRMQAQNEAPSLQMNRQVGRSSIELPQSVEVVDVDVSERSAEPAPTWDIEVEGTGNFVAQGFIVHNSKLTMKYPAVWLMEPHARGEVLSVAFASDGQHQDAGGKVVHVAPNTSSQIVSKSISKGTGRSSYRGLLKVQKGARGVKSNVRCDALLLDETSRTDTYPYIEIEEEDVEVGHEATVSKVGEEQLFYLMSRGLSESEAYTMIVSGFIEPIAKELPLEYAVELNRLIQLEMSGSVG